MKAKEETKSSAFMIKKQITQQIKQNEIIALGKQNGDTKCLNFKKVKYY